jgi:CheY-like chemotaxis protein
MKGDEARCREAGMDAYLTTPTSTARAAKTMNVCMQRV